MPPGASAPRSPLQPRTGRPGDEDDEDRAVRCESLTVAYGSTVAVDGVSFDVHHGEVLALLGPNGAGKTSTVETLEGYRRPSGGTATVLGLDPQRDHRALVRRIGVMLQDGGVYPMLDPGRALRLFASYYDSPAPVGELLARLGLEEVVRTPWRHLSGGEQRRLALALALIGRPELVLLDEPTAGVDPEGRLAVRREIRSLADGGVTVVLTTHELDEAQRLADRVVVLRRGRVVADGTPTELAGAAGPPGVRFRVGADLDPGALGAALGTEVVQEGPGEYTIRTAHSPTLTASLTAWLASQDIALLELRTGRSLEEAYLGLMATDREEAEDATTAGDPARVGGAPERDSPAGGGRVRGRRRGRRGTSR